MVSVKLIVTPITNQALFSWRQPAGAYNLQLGTNDAERIKLTGLKVKSGGLAADSLYYLGAKLWKINGLMTNTHHVDLTTDRA